MKITAELIQQGLSADGFQPGDCVPVRICLSGAGPRNRVKVVITDFVSNNGKISRSCSSVLQTEVIDYCGNHSEQWLDFQYETECWGYIQLGQDTEPGEYQGKVVIKYQDERIENCGIILYVRNTYRAISNLEDFNSLARIKWFQSDAFQESDGVPPSPFVPLRCTGNEIAMLGRTVEIGLFGLPRKIGSYFDQQVLLCEERTELLRQGFVFQMSGETFREKACTVDGKAGRACINTENESQHFFLRSSGWIEFDGAYSLTMELEAKQAVTVQDTSLRIAFCSPKYFMGLGLQGGKIPEEYEFRWNETVNQDGFWAGDVNGGLKLRLRDEVYHKPNVNIYYCYKPIQIPKSWDNEGNGSIRVKNGSISVCTGERAFSAGEKIIFGLDLWITPFKPIDYQSQFGDRYYHTYHCESPQKWIKEVSDSGANVINIHHGTDLNPYINYPFYETEALKKFTREAHSRGARVKVYNTVRELTTRMKEFPVIRSLGYEVLEPSKGIEGATLWQEDARKWIVEQIGGDIIPAWREEIPTGKYAGQTDASVLTNGQSRLCNYYIEGLNYLLQKVGVDGIYIDDVAFDRITMKRVARVLAQKKGTLVDLHSWNHMNERAGMTSSVYQYMELLPYVNRVWLGEGFDYDDTTPEYWLIEMSGIPYGIMGEMLQNGGNFYRGMVFGEVNRLGWNGESPEPLWKLWDEFGICDSRMYGWWNDSCPVRTTDNEVLASCYVKKERALIAIASWAEGARTVNLQIPGVLPFEPKKIHIPYIAGKQEEQHFSLENSLRVAPKQGVILLLER